MSRSSPYRLWRQVPNAISLARLCATPVLLFASMARQEALFKWLLLACLLSDILDGLIARVFRLQTPLGALLDSIADMVVCVLGLIGLFTFKTNILAAHWVALSIVVTLYLSEAAAALWRYGRISSFHTILVRVAAYLQGFFVISLFLWGYSGVIFYLMIAISVLAYAEEMALLFLLPAWTTDVRGIYWVMSKKAVTSP